ncbi:hypothetical protein [Sulfitobacter guttiformis]|uniref:hypothetical protein n=1 Tax=Sulfitobacter guttiformis TaxID=74349 RepID=UPI00046A00A6|nr:hypothetical protein [Sulfitobacter guttiformis]KIN72034.1 hypothetical protein Z949_1201 [Sulfitobacter guttiformis KCTC 32187]
MSFFAALRALDGLHADLEAMSWIKTNTEYDWCGTIRFEDVTANPARLGQIFDDLGVRTQPDVIAALTSLPALNQHASETGGKTSADKWADWHQWQREAFKMSFEKLELSYRYNTLGYDFDELNL